MEQIQISNELKSLETSSIFISKNFQEFGTKYKEKFIAVKENILLAVGNSFNEVINKLKTQNIDPSSVIVEYIPSEEEILAI